MTHLVGRAKEFEAARIAIDRPDVRCVVAHGPGGVGKTALLQSVLQAAARDGALVGVGKYAEGGLGGDLEPIVSAIEAAVAAGLDQLYDPEAGLRNLADTLGENASLLAAIGGELLRSLAQGPTARRTTAEEGEAQITRALLQLLNWLEGFEVPVVLLIDDWGRGSERAQRFFSALLSDPFLKLTRLLATEREEEAATTVAGRVIKIAVRPLAPEAQLELAGRALGARKAAAGEVVAYLADQAARPFDLLEAVRVLTAADAVIKLGSRWRLDPTRATEVLSGAVVASAVAQALDRTADARPMAALLAVHGDGALVADLARAGELSPKAAQSALSALADYGLVRWTGEGVEFSHDRLRAQVLLGVTRDERRRLAGALAEALRQGGAAPDDGHRGATMLWLRQEAGLLDADARWWRDAFTLGASNARTSGDRIAAHRFVASAMQLAAMGPGETYALLAEAAYAAIAKGQDADARSVADRMEHYATTAVERSAADEMRVFARRASGDLDGALEVARTVLARRGVKAPRRVTPWTLALALLRVRLRNPKLAQTPLSPERLAVEAPMMRALNGVGSLLFERDPRLVTVLITSSLSRDLVYGTAAGAGTYALMSCAMGDYRRAAAWAQASDRLQRPDQPLRAVAKQYSSSFGHVFARPRHQTRNRGEQMAALAYVEGDLAVAAYGNRDTVLDDLFSDSHLEDTVARADAAIEIARQLGEPATIPHVLALRQFIDQIRTLAPAPSVLNGEIFDADAQTLLLQRDGLDNVARAVASLQAMLGVLFGDYRLVAELAKRPWPNFKASPFQSQSQVWGFATGLALYRTGGRPSAFVRWNLGRLSKLNPNDYRHRSLLLCAEKARSKGRRHAALAAYGQAVDAAAASRCLLEHGLVAQAASEGAEMLGDESSATRWREAAKSAWRRLGADGLLSHHFGLASNETTADRSQQHGNIASSRLLATVGHELRGPLQSALSLIDLAQAQADGSELSKLRRTIGHLAEIVGDLTDLGALDGGVFKIRRTPFDVVSLAQSVIALHEPQARSTGRQLGLKTGADAAWVLGDEVRIAQVLGNLIGNAIKHGSGAVNVSIRHDRSEQLIVAVSDEGPALDPAKALRIFEPFDRAGAAADSSGMGVGLFLSQRLARAMGGELSVRPCLVGKAFELRVPAPAVSPAQEEPAAQSTLSELRVLLAEDEDLSRQSLARILRLEGCAVVEAATGLEAMAILDKDRFDVLLLDQQLGAVSGLQVAKRAAQSPAPSRVLLLSANVDDRLRRQAQLSKVDLVLQKPISRETLLSAVCSTPASDRARLIEDMFGKDNAELLQALRPAVLEEIDALAALIAQGDAGGAAARLHRLKGMCSHFGLLAISDALALADPADPTLPRRLREAATAVKWPGDDRRRAQR